MADCTASRRPVSCWGGPKQPDRLFAARGMAISTVLKIIVAVCVANLSTPSAVGNPTAHVLTTAAEEVAVVVSSPSAPEVVIPENASEISANGRLISPEADRLTGPDNGGQASATTAGRTAAGDLPPAEPASTRVANVLSTSHSLPPPVISVPSVHVTNHAVSLCLVQPVGAEGSVSYFLVTESLLDGARSWNRSHDVYNGTTVCLSKRDLVGGTAYSVQVVARDDDVGRSESGLLNITTALPPIELDLDPVLELLDGKSTSVTLQWYFGNLTRVERFVFAYNQTDDYPGGFRQHGTQLLDGPTRNVTLTGIYPGANYALYLQGFSGPYTTTFARPWTPETEPPSHLRPLVTTSTSMELAWTFPPHTPTPLVRHFQVTYKVIRGGDPRRHGGQTVQLTDHTSIVLEGLIPDAEYEVNVSTISISGRPSYARTIFHETAIASPRITTFSATTTSFTIVWDHLPTGSYHHVVTCSACPLRTQRVGVGLSRATFRGLSPGNVYNGTVVALKDSLLKSDAATYRELTYPESPSAVYVRLPDPHATSLVVSWHAQLCPGCRVDSYATSLVVARSPRRVYRKRADCAAALAAGGSCHAVYDSLEPGRVYRAEVRAVRMDLRSDPPAISRDIRIPPATPGPITFNEVTHTKIGLSWSPPYGAVDSYSVSLCRVAQPPTAECPCKARLNSSTTVFKCPELTARTSYNVSLSAKSGGLASRARWVVKATTSDFPAVANRPPKAPSIDDVTPYTFPVTFDTSFFDNPDRAILYYTVLVAEASAVSHANLPKYGNLSDGLKTHTWAKAMDSDTIQRYQIADRYAYEDLVSESGKREAYAKRTIVVGEEDCLEDAKEVYCNGPLKDNKIYVYQFRAFTATGFADTPFSHHVILPEDNSGVVAGISVVLILLFFIVLVLIGMIMGRKFRGNYGKYLAARSMEPLPVAVMTRASTSRRYSRPVRLVDFSHDFQVMNAHCHYGFSQEYETVMKVGRKLTCNAAVLAANVSKNRYTNILPFDRTRVMLSPIDDVEGSDYINANYISGYASPREYIACQGPLPGTVDDMWRLIWEQDVATIVMLTQLVEKATVKCDQYWEEDNPPYLHGEIQVTLTGTTELEHWTIRDFTLEKGDATKKVRHFHYLAWPDHGVPDSSTALLNFIRTVRKQVPKNGTPTIVHCSAGVGRTGTFVCLDRLVKHMEEFDFVDILSVTCDLRMHRSYMVQTEQQYVFIHKCVLDMLEEKGIAPKRLPSISSLDTCDMVSTRQGSNASTYKPRLSDTEGDTVEAVDVVVFRQRPSREKEEEEEDDDDAHKRFSVYSMGSARRMLIEDVAEGTKSPSPVKRGSSNGMAKKISKHVREEYV